MRIYAIEGPHEVYASESLAAAEGYFEAIDVENDEYVIPIEADQTGIERK